MDSATRAAHEIEVTTESLQEDLARLKIQKQALERELAAVAAHLDSVQRALSALTVFLAEPSGRRTAEQPEQTKADTPVVSPAARTARKRSAPRKAESTQKEKPTASSPAEADESHTYGSLTEQILEYFAGVGNAEVRARDVAAALGRDTDSGSINAVRSTLDRLVGTSRVRRAGRGLYRAQKS